MKTVARRLGFVGLSVVAICNLLVPSAHAQPYAGAKFVCEMTYPSWPGTGGPMECTGKVVGATVVGGQPVVCENTECDISIYFLSYSESCTGGQLPVLGAYSGTVFVDGSFLAYIAMQRSDHVAFITMNNGTTGGGLALWLPASSTASCSGPTSTTAVLEGTLFVLL